MTVNIKPIRTVAKASTVVGCVVIILGLFYKMVVNAAALCLVQNIYGRPYNFSPLIVPAIAGGMLIVAGTWAFRTFKPRGPTPASTP